MHKVAKRALILFALIGPLVAGVLLFVIRFSIHSGSWAVFDGAPHVYNGNNIGCGVVVDADNVLLLDMLEGRTYSNSENLRKSTIHWLGDRLGYISAPAVAEYAEEMAGFDLKSTHVSCLYYLYINEALTSKELFTLAFGLPW